MNMRLEETPAYRDEPALTIGETFADQKLIKAFVAAAVGIASILFGAVIDSQLVDYITTVIFTLSMVLTPLLAQREASKRSMEQARETRDHVYAPSTVEKIKQEAYEAGVPPVEPIPETRPPVDPPPAPEAAG